MFIKFDDKFIKKLHFVKARQKIFGLKLLLLRISPSMVEIVHPVKLDMVMLVLVVARLLLEVEAVVAAQDVAFLAHLALLVLQENLVAPVNMVLPVFPEIQENHQFNHANQ